MTMHRSQAQRLLEAAAGITETLARQKGPYTASPFLATLLLLAGLLALSQPGATYPALAALAVSTPLLPRLAAETRSAAGRLVAPIVIVGSATLLVTAPLALQGRLWEVIDTTLRAAASTAVATMAVTGYGWAVFAATLGRVAGPEAAQGLMLLLAAAARLTRRLAVLAAAREARSLSQLPLRERWRLLASSAAGLLDYSYTASTRLEAAIRARTLGAAAPCGAGAEDPPASLLPLLPSIAAIVFYLAQVLLHG